MQQAPTIPQKQVALYQKAQNIPMSKIQYHTKQLPSNGQTLDPSDMVHVPKTQQKPKQSELEQSAQSGGNFD